MRDASYLGWGAVPRDAETPVVACWVLFVGGWSNGGVPATRSGMTCSELL